MVRLYSVAHAVVVLGVFALTSLPAAAQAAADEELFHKNCQTCHSLAADAGRRAGPNLQQVFGRAVGTLADFPYSDALKQADFAWTAEAMDAWLTNPQAYLPGTYMMYRQSDPEIRLAIIRYLQTAAGAAAQQQ